MIPVRLTAPHPLIEYFLDCAQEAGELDACSGMTLRLYGSDDEMMPIAAGEGPCHYRKRREHCLEMAAIADRILPQLPEQRRAGLICAGMKHVVHALTELTETMAMWAMEDEIEGGCMEHFRDRPRQRKGITFKHTDRRLRSPNFIRRYVKGSAPEHADHLMALTGLMLRRARECDGAVTYDPSLMADWRAQIMHRRKVDDLAERVTSRQARKVIRRSLSTAIAVAGLETVRAFLRGEQVRLIGQETILMLRKKGGLADKGHGCLSVALADRSGTRLADLCTFIEGTPTLDQLSGFALWMQSGEEQQVLDTANIIDLAPAGKEHPALIKRAADAQARAAGELTRLLGDVDATRIIDLMKGRDPAGRRQLTREERRERNNAYWEETKGEWLEAMMVAVIGYRNLPIFKQAGAL